MYVLVSLGGSYARALGLKDNIINAFKFKTAKQAGEFAERHGYVNYIIKEI